MRPGLDRLLAAGDRLGGRRYALLSHQASVSSDLQHAHLALARRQPPVALLAPEHGFYGVEQDMVPAREEVDPWTGARVVSLYGDRVETLRPDPGVFAGIDLLIVDLQDVGARYYTFAATAVWSAEAALEAGCEIWVLDRPNPIGGVEVEGNLVEPGLESFVSAFSMPARHGLTLGEVVLLEGARRGWSRDAVDVFAVDGWEPSTLALDGGAPWVAPSPNMPCPLTALLYPGLCLIEATELSEGRGTTRPFQLVGAPGVDAPALAAALEALEEPGVRFLPAMFRPQFQKHAGRVCAGVELVVVDARALRPFRLGVRLLATLAARLGSAFGWRRAPYEFVSDRPAIDLLAGSPELRELVAGGADGSSPELLAWIDGWRADQEVFREERAPVLLYPRGLPVAGAEPGR
ncbi:MAG TPA: DUF1343 domain-containing protein [Thermoanaerobaculia bacterium]|nr:DUF1343 domain-containing protein [Thermoanaerobaculia bacterium]